MTNLVRLYMMWHVYTVCLCDELCMWHICLVSLYVICLWHLCVVSMYITHDMCLTVCMVYMYVTWHVCDLSVWWVCMWHIRMEWHLWHVSWWQTNVMLKKQNDLNDFLLEVSKWVVLVVSSTRQLTGCIHCGYNTIWSYEVSTLNQLPSSRPFSYWHWGWSLLWYSCPQWFTYVPN